MLAVHTMRPIGTDGTCCVVCMSVCCSHECVAKCHLKTDSSGSKEPCITWRSRGNFGVVCHIKSTGCVCCSVHSKRDHSIVNDSMTRDADFRPNSLTICYIFKLQAVFLFSYTRLLLNKRKL